MSEPTVEQQPPAVAPAVDPNQPAPAPAVEQQPPAVAPAVDPNQPAPAPAVEPPAAAAAAPTFTLDPDRGPCYNGVPLFDFDNPYGGYGVGVLVGVDLEAKHEIGQRRMIPDTDPPQYEDVPKSGGSAYYQDLFGSHGWSTPLNPESAS